MNPDATRLRALVNGNGDPGAEKPPAKPAKSRSLLPSPEPEPGASTDELLGWTTVSTALGDDPIVGIVRHGTAKDARMVINLRSGARIVFDEQDEAFDPRRLVRAVKRAVPRATIPVYTSAADAQAIASAMLRAADVLAADDDRDEARGWARSFCQLARCNVQPVENLTAPEARFNAIAMMMRWNPQRDPEAGLPPAAYAILIEADDGTTWLRTSDFKQHVASEGARMSWAKLNGRMLDVGWVLRGEVEQRMPGAGRGGQKVKCHVWEVPAEWDA